MRYMRAFVIAHSHRYSGYATIHITPSLHTCLMLLRDPRAERQLDPRCMVKGRRATATSSMRRTLPVFDSLKHPLFREIDRDGSPNPQRQLIADIAGFSIACDFR